MMLDVSNPGYLSLEARLISRIEVSPNDPLVGGSAPKGNNSYRGSSTCTEIFVEKCDGLPLPMLLTITLTISWMPVNEFRSNPDGKGSHTSPKRSRSVRGLVSRTSLWSFWSETDLSIGFCYSSYSIIRSANNMHENLVGTTWCSHYALHVFRNWPNRSTKTANERIECDCDRAMSRGNATLNSEHWLTSISENQRISCSAHSLRGSYLFTPISTVLAGSKA